MPSLFSICNRNGCTDALVFLALIKIAQMPLQLLLLITYLHTGCVTFGKGCISNTSACSFFLHDAKNLMSQQINNVQKQQAF